MGYSQSSNWNVTLPKEKLAEFDALIFTTAESLHGYTEPLNRTAEDASHHLVGIFGEDGDLFYDNGTIQGWTSGKTNFEAEEEILEWLAKNGASGFIDYRGEDEALWRVRFHDGKAVALVGEIVYPEDPVK